MSGAADQAAEDFLATAYPDDRQRGHAERWLGLLACQVVGGGPVRWWQIPALAPARVVLTARRLVVCVTAVAVIGSGMFIGFTQSMSPEFGIYAIGLFLVFRGNMRAFREAVRHPPAQLRAEAPRAIRPHWPRGWAECGRLLRWALLLGAGILPGLVKQWSVRAAELPAATPAGTYRSERLSCLVTGLAWGPVGAVLGALAAWGTGSQPEVMAIHAVAAVIWGALLSGSYPLVKLSEVVMSADWEDRIRFLPLLEDAADRGVLRRARAGYEFSDDALRIGLIGIGRAALEGHLTVQAHRAARPGVRAALVKHLTRRGRIRVLADLTVGVAIAAGVGSGIEIAHHGGVVTRTGGPAVDGLLFPVGAMLGVMAGVLFAALMAPALSLVASGSTMTLTYLPRLSRNRRRGWAVAAAVAAAALIVGEGAVLAGIIAFVLPAALVMGCGTWACVLVFRRTRAFGRRWQRAAPDVIAAATTGATLLVLADHRLLSALPAAGLLFPVAAWGSFLLWRMMTRSQRRAVKVAADLVFALLLGGELVVLLVWAANLLGMPSTEVVLLRSVLGRAGELADLPWWAWTGAWVLLAGVSVAFIRWPSRLKKAAERFGRWRVVTIAETTERALTGLHIGLLTVVFVGLAAPSAVTPTVDRHLTAAYEVAFQRDLLEEGELRAYMAISSQLAAEPKSPILTRLVARINDISPAEDPREASGTELDIARRLGEAEAVALRLGASPSLDATVHAATAAAGLTGPAPEPSDLARRGAAVQEQRANDDAAAKRVETAADTAAKVVASLVSIPQLSDNEVVQIVREYLAGLIEDSSLKVRFAAWFERLPGAKPPPDAATEVVPAPKGLERAATAELSAEFTAAGDQEDPVTDPFAVDPALTRAQTEDPLDGAVDIINQARYAQDRSGPCVSCSVPGSDGNAPGEEPPEDHQEEP